MIPNYATSGEYYRLSTDIVREIRATLLVLFFIMVYSLNAQQTYTFTNSGATGRLGPSQTQVNNSYSGGSLAGSVTVIGNGIQQFIVPNSGSYRIKVAGAKGGDGRNGSTATAGGAGAIVQAEFNLTGGQTVQIVAGQLGISTSSADTGGGGGGGSYVSVNSSPLIVAGGGGSGGDNNTGGTSGTTYTYGLAGNGTGGAGGTAGGGGTGNGNSGGGGGYSSNGTTAAGGTAFVNGSEGGPGTYGDGGFGGGGGGNDASLDNGAGGGGYSGGGGGGSNAAGGGGGSFIASGAINIASSNGLYNGSTVANLGAFNSGHGYVVIEQLCSITLSASSNAICAGNSVTITTNAISNYSWTTGSTSSSLVVSPSATTFYGLTATSPSNCTSSAQVSIIVTQTVPILSISNSSSGNNNGVCPNGTVALTANGAVTYTWTGGVSNGVSFSPASASSYTVTGENGCGTSSAVTSVSIHPSPTLSPVSVVNPTMCSGTTNTLTASGTGIGSYLWNTSSTSNSITVSPVSNTNYFVTAFSPMGCTATAASVVTVVTTPVQVPVASPAVICAGGSSTLSAVAPSFTWLPGNENTSSIVVTTTTSGVHTYTVIKANGVCTDTKTVAITVNALPLITAQASPTVVCESIQTATLTGTGGISYSWSPEGGNGPVAFVTASANTIYTLSASNGTCVGSNTVLLAVNPLPTIVVSAPAPFICLGEVITLSVTGGSSYTWSPVSSSIPYLVDNPQVTTQYSVAGKNSAGCISGAAVTVSVYPVPVLNLGIDRPVVCAGNPAILSVSGADTYAWSNGSAATDVTVNPVQSTIFSVTGTYALGNCSTTETVLVEVVSPTLVITGNNTICQGETATLTANANGAINYNWNAGPPAQSIFVSPTITTIYVATATVSTKDIVCTANNNFVVTVYILPNIVAIPDRQNVCVDETVTFSAAGGTAYAWSWGSQNSNSPTFSVTPLLITNVVVNVTGVGANGCSNTATSVVLVSPCMGINGTSVPENQIRLFPNPSQGEINVVGYGPAELVLINETGQLIRTVRLVEQEGYSVRLSGLGNGIYFITGKSANIKMKEKIIINR
jgi:hypothetical protein